MNKETYRKTAYYINSRPKLKKAVVFAEKHSSKPIMAIFFGLLVFLTLSADVRVFAVGAIPLIVFVCTTVLRKKLNFPRPFEEIGFESVTHHSKGCSCPSRHASSAAVITMAAFFISTSLGIVSAVFAFIICISRVVTGVHYIRDVMCGVLLGGIAGFIGFFIIL